MKKTLFIVLLSPLFFLSAKAQQYIPLDNLYYQKLHQHSVTSQSPFFSSLKPVTTQELNENFNVKEILYEELETEKYSDKYIWRKLFKEDFIKWEKDNYRVTINPLFNFEIGREFKDRKTTWVNTRGISVSGNITNKLFVNSEIFENQAVYPNWLDEFSRKQMVTPGEGAYKFYGKNNKAFDFSSSSGYISYNPIKEINFTLGYGKNFIGDGYRSLILSDIGFNYPYLRVSATVDKFKYTALYTQMTEHDALGADNRSFGFDRKWVAMHYAQVMLWDRLELGLWDAVVFENSDSTRQRGFDMAYLNPIIFLRPQEFAIGSPDNMLIGGTFNLRINNMFNAYGQLVLDEFKAKELFSSKGWWANKYGLQVGIAGWNLFKIQNLNARAEYNQVRPYTYSHWASIQGYSNYGQPLAHPMGANFREGIAMASYKKNNWLFNVKINFAQYGLDTTKSSFGKDVFKSYNLRPQEYDNKIAQGLKTSLLMADFNVAYLLNRHTNMRLEVGVTTRNEKNNKFNKESIFVYVGFKTGLRNLYHDF